MKKKILGSLICMLFIAATLQATGTINGMNRELNSLAKESTPVSDIDWWPMWRHDAGNTGSSTSKAPNTNELTWQQYIGEEIYSSSPVIVEDKLYISTDWYYMLEPPETPPDEPGDLQNWWIEEKPNSFPELFELLTQQNENYSGGIYCLNADTGSQIWNYVLDSPIDPAIVDGKVYLTDIDYYSYYSTLYCLDADTGSHIWDTSLSTWVTSSATIVEDEKIYLGALDYYSYSGTFCCYDINGSSLWNYTLPTYELMLYTAPAVSDGRVYFITVDLYSYNGNLYCLDADTGQFLWSQQISSWFYWWFGSASPVCANGNVYIVDIDFYSYNGNLECYNAVTGNKEWSYQIGWSFSTPAFYENSIFVIDIDWYSYSGWIYRINATTGSLIWKAAMPGYTYFFSSGSPVVADDMIYITPLDYFYYYSQDIYCLDADDGDVIWSYSLNYPTLSSPSIANGRVYIPDLLGTVYAFGRKNEPPSIPTIQGEIKGRKKKSYEYTFESTDPEGDGVFYFIYWGDGSMEPWHGPHASGDAMNMSHAWEEKGTYNISAKAKDSYGSESDWGILQVSMPKNQMDPYVLFYPLLAKLRYWFPLLANILSYLYLNEING
jgi:outer membrane protein assembly factor BamB